MKTYEVNPYWERAVSGSLARSWTMWTCAIFFLMAIQGIFFVALKTWKTPETQTVQLVLLVILWIVFMSGWLLIRGWKDVKQAVLEAPDIETKTLLMKNSYNMVKMYYAAMGAVFISMNALQIILGK
jgi:hypothetical protein